MGAGHVRFACSWRHRVEGKSWRMWTASVQTVLINHHLTLNYLLCRTLTSPWSR